MEPRAAWQVGVTNPRVARGLSGETEDARAQRETSGAILRNRVKNKLKARKETMVQQRRVLKLFQVAPTNPDLEETLPPKVDELPGMARPQRPHSSRKHVPTPRSVASKVAHPRATKVVRIQVKTPRPFCNVRKYDEHRRLLKLQKGTDQRPPDPYFTPWEQELNRERESRKKWVGPHFSVTDHKAVVARREWEQKSHDCCIISGPYNDPKPIGRDEVKAKWITRDGFYLATRRLGTSDAADLSEGATPRRPPPRGDQQPTRGLLETDVSR